MRYRDRRVWIYPPQADLVQQGNAAADRRHRLPWYRAIRLRRSRLIPEPLYGADGVSQRQGRSLLSTPKRTSAAESGTVLRMTGFDPNGTLLSAPFDEI